MNKISLFALRFLSIVLVLIQISGTGWTNPPEKVSPGDAKIEGTYMIQNQRHELLLRPQNANKSDGAPIVLYPKYPWKCLSWRFESRPDLTYRLMNLFTGKTMQPKSGGRTGAVQVIQGTPKTEKSSDQFWRLVPLKKGLYRISNIAGDKVLTAVQADPGGEIHIYLMPWMDKKEQKWKLLDLPEKLTM